MGRSKKELRPYFGLLFGWGLTSIFSLVLGAVDYPDQTIILNLRLPRLILSSAVGMGLSVAGAALQALFSNPLCEPYTLGIASGSAFGVIIGMALGIEVHIAGLAASGFLGALAFTAILYFLSRRPESTNVTLLLSGVLLGFFGSSLVTIWISISDANGLQAALGWLFGDLSRARMNGAIFSAIVTLILTCLIWKNWREMDALLLGEETASTLGIDLPSVRIRIILLTSILIGVSVSAAGMIGFVGLIIPHLSRILVGSLHKRLIPMTAICGAAALTTADWVSRILIRPYELPIGVITSLIGSPILFWILLKKKQ